MRRVFVFLVVAIFGYIGTVAAAFVFWSLTGASGGDYTPLLLVLFVVAPAVACVAGLVAAGRPRRRATPREAAAASPVPPPTARRNGPLQWAIAIAGALLVGAAMLALDHVPGVPHIPHAAFR